MLNEYKLFKEQVYVWSQLLLFFPLSFKFWIYLFKVKIRYRVGERDKDSCSPSWSDALSPTAEIKVHYHYLTWYFWVLKAPRRGLGENELKKIIQDIYGTREMTHQLRKLTVLTNNPDSVPSTHTQKATTSISRPR